MQSENQENGGGGNQCDRCGDEYESYAVFVKDDFSAITEFLSNRRGYDNLCKPCRAHISDGKQAFAGAADVEPKTGVSDNGA